MKKFIFTCLLGFLIIPLSHALPDATLITPRDRVEQIEFATIHDYNFIADVKDTSNVSNEDQITITKIHVNVVIDSGFLLQRKVSYDQTRPPHNDLNSQSSYCNYYDFHKLNTTLLIHKPISKRLYSRRC